MKWDLLLSLIVYLFLLFLSFVASIVLGWGQAESSREISSLWYYGRRGLLIAAALAIPWFTRKQPLSALGWNLPWKWILFAIATGVCMGFFNRGGFDLRKTESLSLAIFHTFSMEVFFRGYLFRTFDRVMKEAWKSLLFSALLYALFYQTIWTTWVQPPGKKALLFLNFTFLGILFAYSYKRSGSFLVNWLMHICAGIQYRLLF